MDLNSVGRTQLSQTNHELSVLSLVGLTYSSTFDPGLSDPLYITFRLAERAI